MTFFANKFEWKKVFWLLFRILNLPEKEKNKTKIKKQNLQLFPNKS